MTPTGIIAKYLVQKEMWKALDDSFRFGTGYMNTKDARLPLHIPWKDVLVIE